MEKELVTDHHIIVATNMTSEELAAAIEAKLSQLGPGANATINGAITVYFERLETDDEFEARKAALDADTRRELALLEKLKEKYE